MANEVLIARGTPITWKDSGGSLVISLNNLAPGAARIGAQKDFGAGSTPEWYSWRFTCPFETAPVVNETIDIYLSTSDGTEEDGQEGVVDALLGTTNSLRNMLWIGSLLVTSTDAAHDMTASGICRIVTQYVCPVIHNNTVDGLKADANVSVFTLTAITPEIQ